MMSGKHSTPPIPPSAPPGSWTCGKEGQSVPVGVGCPTIKIDGVTVGGTQVS